MKTLFFALISLLIISGCKKDEVHPSPEIFLSNDEGITRVFNLYDTILVGRLYKVYVFVKDEEQKNLPPIFFLGDDTVPTMSSTKSFPIKHSLRLSDVDTTYYFNCYEPGSYSVVIKAVNKYNSICLGSLLHLECYENKSPNPKLSVTNTTGNPLTLSLDASASFDPDKRYGGGIIMYEFSINDFKTGEKLITSYNPVITYTVDAPGDYVIGVRVLDNDNAWSIIWDQVQFTIK